MPRQPDPQLEIRILKAAQKLFLRGGEKGLSMRALAKAARTNTPAVYRRYKSRKHILEALVQRIQQDLFTVLEPCDSLQDAYRRVLEFALEHPHEYQLMNAAFSKVSERPNLEFMKKRSAEWLGGDPEDHTDLILVLWALAHGTASLLISRAVPPLHEMKLRSVVDKAAGLLVQNASILANRK